MDMLPRPAFQLRANPGRAGETGVKIGAMRGFWRMARPDAHQSRLLPRKGLPGVNSLDAGQTGRPKC